MSDHNHPELEDRMTAEIAGVHTEILALRTDMRRGFTAVVQAIEGQGETMRQHSEILTQILDRLPEPDGDA